MKTIAKNSGHKAAQRRFKAEVCLLCGVKKRLQRHHKDLNPTNNSPNNIMILCQTCHTQIHVIDGTWGRKKEDLQKAAREAARDKLGRFCAKERPHI
jgi:5-methylcytosine-specific restriction endonuclease McrA